MKSKNEDSTDPPEASKTIPSGPPTFGSADSSGSTALSVPRGPRVPTNVGELPAEDTDTAWEVPSEPSGILDNDEDHPHAVQSHLSD